MTQREATSTASTNSTTTVLEIGAVRDSEGEAEDLDVDVAAVEMLSEGASVVEVVDIRVDTADQGSSRPQDTKPLPGSSSRRMCWEG